MAEKTKPRKKKDKELALYLDASEEEMKALEDSIREDEDFNAELFNTLENGRNETF